MVFDLLSGSLVVRRKYLAKRLGRGKGSVVRDVEGPAVVEVETTSDVLSKGSGERCRLVLLLYQAVLRCSTTR